MSQRHLVPGATLLRLLLPLMTVLLARCFPGEVPADVQISCRTTADCPARYVCSPSAGRCTSGDVVDKPPVLAGTPTLAPRVARAGVLLTVDFNVNEELAQDPVVRLGELPLSIDEDGTNRSRQSYRYSYLVAGTEPEGEPGVKVTIGLKDIGGNAVEGLEGGIAYFDFTAPVAPDVSTEGRVVYHRYPWGAEATEGAQRYWIEAVAQSAEPGTEVAAYDEDPTLEGSGSTTAAQMGYATVGADGSFHLDLARIDRPRIHLIATDLAGNRSPVVDVKDVVWTATLSGKAQGREFENPHDYEVRSWFERRYQQPEAQLALVDAQPIAARDGQELTATGTGHAGSWLRRSPGTGFSRRESHALAYDLLRGRVLLFGGGINTPEYLGGGGAGFADLWQWDGTAWTRRTPTDPELDGDPSARKGHAMAYDAARDRLVLYGGEYKQSALGDLWEWDGASWMRGSPQGPVPAARSRHALAYDSERQRVVLFGGEVRDLGGSRTYFDDLWEWDGVKWSRLGTGVAPAARSEHSMAYDSERKRMVVFGGNVKNSTGQDSVHQDTWEWDGAAWRAVLVETKPKARRGHGLVYLPRVGIVLFGGDDGSSFYADLWGFDGTGWVEKTPPPPGPRSRTRAGMAYDVARKRLVLCGGGGDQGNTFDDTWEWDGAGWVSAADVAAPPARRWHSLAYDVGRARTVLFGGESQDGEQEVRLNDTWEWDGTRWRDLTPAAGAPCPSPRKSSALAYDAVRQRIVLFGGIDDSDPDAPQLHGDTWEWDGERWKERTPPGLLEFPFPRYGHAMVFDAAAGEVLLYGGTNHQGYTTLADTWLWNGAVWRVARSDSHAYGRCFHALAYDTARKRVVLYGGQVFSETDSEPLGWPFSDGDTYEWDGSEWVFQVPEGNTSPSPLTGHAMAYGQRGNVILFGGGTWVYGSYPLDATWAWDGQRWVELKVGIRDDGIPLARSGHALVYDSGRSRAVLFGGWDAAGNTLSDTWEWEDGASARPGQVARFAFASAQAESNAVIRSVTATWWAGGTGENARTPMDGVSTYVWDRGTFIHAASGSFGLSAPGMVKWTTTDEEQTSRLLTGPRQEIALAITAQGANGTGSARVEVDYVELQVRYRR